MSSFTHYFEVRRLSISCKNLEFGAGRGVILPVVAGLGREAS